MAEEKKVTKKTKKVTEPKEAPKTKKEEKKPEAPKKPTPTSAKAIAKNVRITPRKARLVIDLVRGKDVNLALAILENTNKAACAPAHA